MKKFIMLMMLMLATLAHASADDDPQPYAVFDNGTLTFYCDNQKATHSDAMELNEGHTVPEWYQYASEITTVEFDPMFKNASPTSCYRWFTEFTNLTEIKGIQYLNTSEVSDMSGMFEGCKALKSLDLSSFNTSEVTDMSYMFSDCYTLESLDLSSFNTKKVTEMSTMFFHCYVLESLNLSSFNTENVTSMSSMFSYSFALKTILVGSGWNVDKVTSSDDMFTDCEKLTGGNGTPYNKDNLTVTYAVIDGKDGKDGYLTSLEQCTPYAELIDNPDGETKTLVFRFGYKPDNAMSLNEGDDYPDWNNNASDITTVEFDPLFKYAQPKTCYYWFYRCEKLTEIKGIQYLNTSEVTDMSYMFKDCFALESLDLSSFNTEKVDKMVSMFSYCYALPSLDLSSFNTEKVMNLDGMFYNCSALPSLDLSSFNTENVTSMNVMFLGCSALETILVGSGWNVDKVTYSFNMFSDCPKLVGGNGTTYQADKTDKTYAVIDGKDGKNGYLTSFKPYAVFDNKTGTLTFYYDKQLRAGAMPLNEGDVVPEWKNNASNITTVVFSESFQYALPTTCYQWFDGCKNLTEIKDIKYLNTAKVTNMGYMFRNCKVLKHLILNYFYKAEAVTNMSSMFSGCSALESLDLRNINTSMVGSMGNMFYNCSALKSLDLSNFNTKKVTKMSNMFSGCSALKSLNLSSFNTENVTKMSDMFSGCSALKSLDLSSFNTENVTEMISMFSGCSALESLDLSSFNTANVTDMSTMFYNCSALESLDLSSFNTSRVEGMVYMFSGCSALETILVGSGWNVDKVTSSAQMFDGCEKLTGGNGTECDGHTNIEVTYARIDGKDGNPGYLTLNALTLTKANGSTTAVLNGDFTDGSGAALIINKEIKVDALTFNRKFTNGVTATVMFPFGFKTSDDIKGTFHTITKVGPDKSGVWTAELSNAITDIKANTPYIFYPSEDITSITFNNITLVPTDGTLSNGDANGWQLHGVYSKKIWEEDSKTEYGFAAVKVEEDNIEAGEFVLAGKDAWADPLRCYLTYAGSGKPFTAKAATVLPDRIRVVFPSDNDDEITTDPAEVITPVSSISETEDVKVWSFGGTVYIESQPDMDYTIIDLTGRIIKTGITHSTREEVTLSRHGAIVIVNINGKSVKVNL